MVVGADRVDRAADLADGALQGRLGAGVGVAAGGPDPVEPVGEAGDLALVRVERHPPGRALGLGAQFGALAQ